MPSANKPSLDTLSEIFRFAVRRFRSARLAYGHGTTNARDEAAFLLLEGLGLPIDRLDPYLDLRPTAEERARLLTLIDARTDLRLPAPYLVGAAYMHGVRFASDRRALVPRSFIGDMLADGILPIGDPGRIKRILDLCTGSGCLAVLAALTFPRAEIDATDLSAGALALARTNVANHRFGDRITLHRGDLFAPLGARRYDLIISNPPYVALTELDSLPTEYHHEPRLGLVAGAEGLDMVEQILRQAADYLKRDGLLIVEVGNAQYALCEALPDVPFTWLEFERGGQGVFLLNAAQLRQL